MRWRHGLISIVLGALVCAPWALPASAQGVVGNGGGPLELHLSATRISQGADGKETSQPATTAKPGEVIEYHATYTNRGKGPLSNVEATLPVPAGLEYTPDTAQPSGALASLDGSLFLPVPLMRKVLKDGREVEVPVPHGEYRALRWKLGEIPAGKNAVVSARMRLSPTITPSQQQAALNSAR